ncbi:MAG: Ig-like domain-containing protein [Desulfotomaculaceae bacterium]|nr:Ig-like domain-containing protein [Desulfotomaculaceae bacterium]
MRVFSNKGLGKLVVIFLMLGLFLSLGSITTAVAADISVKVTGDGVTNPKTYTQAELETMDGQVGPRLYSTINTWPTKNWYAAKGVKIAKLLEEAGIKDEAKTIIVKSSDGFKATFTRKELLEDDRYYYPRLKENHEFFGHIPGSPDDAEKVDAILALKSVNSDNLNALNDRETPHLIFGQRWVTEQTNHAFVKYVSEIEVTTATPGKWANPTAEPAGGTVPAGTLVELKSQFNDSDKVYYTVDGNDPTYKSPIYNWIANRWWGARQDELNEINHPIEIKSDTTIKAITIGLGKEDSDIVSFNYQVLLAAAPILTADTTDNTVGQPVELTFTDDAAWRAAITSVTVKDTVLSSNQYTISEGNINIVASVFSTAGDYLITVQATGYTDTTVTQPMVNASGGEEPVTLNLSGSTAEAGDSVTASGTATPNDWVPIKVVDSTQSIVFFDTTKADASGNYSFDFIIPDGASGVLTVVAGSGSNVASKTLTVTVPSDTTAPVWTDGSLTASDVSQTGLTLSWNAASDNIGVTEYKVYQDGVVIDTVSSDIRTYNVTDLTAGTEYTFKVEACDANGNWSTDGPSVTATTLDETPYIVTLNLSKSTAEAGDSVTASGTATPNDWVPIKVVDSTQSIIFFDTAKADASGNYSFDFIIPDGASGILTVVAGSGSNVASKTLIVTVPSDTTAPVWTDGSLTASDVSLTGLTLSWNAASDNIGVTEYKVYQDGVVIDTVSSDIRTYNVAGLTAGTEYTFKVEAGDANGNWSTDGPSVTATTLDETPYIVTLNLSKSTAEAGDSVTASGTAKPNDWVPIKVVDSTQSIVFFDTAKADASGNYSFDFIIPDGASGILTVVAGSGSNVASKTLTVTTNSDTTAPAVSSSDPADGATGVAIDKTVAITFSEDIVAGDAYGQISLKDAGNNSVAITKSISGNVLSINPDANLGYSSIYTVTVPAGAVEDAAGNGLAGAYTLSFTTGVAPDTTAPAVSSSDPADGATGVAIDKTVAITFSEDIVAGDAYEQISLKDAANNSVAITKSISGNVLSLDPEDNLGYSSTYTVTVPAGAIEDAAGNGLAGAYTLSFTTKGDPGTGTDNTPPIWSNGSLTASNVGQTTLTLTWSGASDNEGVTGYRIYRGTTLLTPTPVSGNSYKVNGLNKNTTYTFKVEAGDAAGNWSTDGPTTITRTLTKPDKQAPTWVEDNLTASNITHSGLTLTWNAATDNVGVTGYRVYQGSKLLTPAPITDLSYTVTGLSQLTKYTFTVQAEDKAGNLSSSGPKITVRTLAAPDTSAPTWSKKCTLSAVDIGQTMLLIWDGALDNVRVTGYKVYQDGTLLTPTPVFGPIYSVTGLTPGVPYTFTVQAGDAAGNWSTDGPSVTAATSKWPLPSSGK